MMIIVTALKYCDAGCVWEDDVALLGDDDEGVDGAVGELRGDGQVGLQRTPN